MYKTVKKMLAIGAVFCALLMFSSCSEEDLGVQALDPAAIRALDAKIDLALIKEQGKAKLRITESFVMPADIIYIRLPNTFLRKDKLYARIEQLQIEDPAEVIDHKKYPFIRVVSYKKGQRLTLSYVLRPDDPINYGADKESPSAPIIRDNYFQFIGMMALIFPVGIEKSEVEFNLSLSWHMPNDFRLFNSYGEALGPQRVSSNYDKLRDSLFIGGNNLRVYTADVRGRPVTITMEGQFKKITDADFSSVVTRLLDEQRETWRDDDFPYFLIHFLARTSPCNGGTLLGTAHPNSFRAVFPDECDFQPAMKQLISHELMHMWIGKKIKVGQAEGHYDGKWFTEGWTDYFGRILAYRAGVLTEDEYFLTLNRQLERYYLTDEKHTTLRELVNRIYRRNKSNKELEAVPYQQGEIMAIRLNKTIKEDTSFKNSLDDVVRAMLKEAADAGGVKNFTVEEIARNVDVYAPHALQKEMEKVEQGGVFVAPSLPQCRTPFKVVNPKNVSRELLLYGGSMHACDAWLK